MEKLHCLNRVCRHIVWFHRSEPNNRNCIDIELKSVFPYNLTFTVFLYQVTYRSAIAYLFRFILPRKIYRRVYLLRFRSF